MSVFDVIIVGGGSAGCTLAARLSEQADVRVLLLEAGGGHRDLMIRMPMAWHPASEMPRYGWGLAATGDAHIAGRVLPQPRGKLLGGTSSINGMMYSRGNRGDYDGWAQSGLAGWDYDSVLPYFRRSETNWRGEGVYHGGNGPMHVSANPREPVVYDAMIATARALGFHEVDDFHGASQEGFGMPDFTVRGGQRESSATAYLEPARSRPNLHIVTGAHVSRILLDGSRITGVEYRRDGAMTTASAAEVILCGGAFHSPHLLQLSGIGPADVLRTASVAVRHDLPGVGRNLQDHPLVPAGFKASAKFSFERLLRMDQLALSVMRWLVTGGGPLGQAPLSVQAYIKTQGDSAWPDTQFQVSHVSFMARPWFPGIRKGAGHQFTAAAMQMRPYGRGSVTLRSADPADQPIINLGLFTDERDKQAARDMLAFIRAFFSTSPVANLVETELFPGAGVSSAADIDTYLAHTLQTSMHPTSSCAMGVNPLQSGVDVELRVHGLSGLRVCDASVMPRIVSGNTGAPTIMIAEKAADMILGREPLPPISPIQNKPDHSNERNGEKP